MPMNRRTSDTNQTTSLRRSRRMSAQTNNNNNNSINTMNTTTAQRRRVQNNNNINHITTTTAITTTQSRRRRAPLPRSLQANVPHLTIEQVLLIQCPICLNSPNDTVTTLCGHVYCHSCISTWIRACGEGATCPLCRVGINLTEIRRFKFMMGRQT
ncbi:5635_t:CDS:2 [Diversispora eburnea]|uniref:5635_t:CDS:1 n=1 Tax=Diversispora eburnea TaxID=1213867 RepID=A0A9N9BYB3_9GLOM|nr:5635_t:CDS:2 [Diversispora eburnea]